MLELLLQFYCQPSFFILFKLNLLKKSSQPTNHISLVNIIFSRIQSVMLYNSSISNGLNSFRWCRCHWCSLDQYHPEINLHDDDVYENIKHRPLTSKKHNESAMKRTRLSLTSFLFLLQNSFESWITNECLVSLRATLNYRINKSSNIFLPFFPYPSSLWLILGFQGKNTRSTRQSRKL